ncbi:long-chain-alcohol oxidase [Aureococcus anophagefferens]|nr:long-chain-alcohol oxidase [Aureococcus anophagefferens]
MAASTMIKLTPAEATVVESLVTALIPPVSRDEALDVARACGDADPSPERLAALMAGGWSETDDWAALGVPCCARADGATPFDGALDAVCALGVSDAGVTHDFGNRAILRGSAALKLPCRVLPQNLDRTDESAAYVAYGDRREQDVDADGVARDAAETGRCFFADGVKVDHVLRAGGRCVGVRCTRGGVARDVRATKAVVLSGGSLNTPAILLRTPGGFPNDHVGRHLRLHPVTPCASRFDGVDARALSASGLLAIGDGAPMTAACEAHVSGPKGDGYGALIERDVGEGRVRLSAGDREPLVDYALDPRDAASMTGPRDLRRVLARAARIASMHTAAPPTADLAGRDGAERDERVDAWAAEVRARGLASDNRLLSAHQMGTCRMGRSPRDSVVDAAGESWELPGLVVDASLFPTASGVNPMITTMALAKVVSDGLVRRLARGADASADAAKVARWAARDRRAGLVKLARAVAAAAAAAVVAVAVAGR